MQVTIELRVLSMKCQFGLQEKHIFSN